MFRNQGSVRSLQFHWLRDVARKIWQMGGGVSIELDRCTYVLITVGLMHLNAVIWGGVNP